MITVIVICVTQHIASSVNTTAPCPTSLTTLATDNITTSPPIVRKRVKRTLFYQDQDALVLLMIVFPYKFPLWDRFVATKQQEGLHAAIAQFPLPLTPRRVKRCVHFDEQISFWIIEVICAYMLPIIPNNIYKKNTLPGVRWRREVGWHEDHDFGSNATLTSPYEFKAKVKPLSRPETAKLVNEKLHEDQLIELRNKTMVQITPVTAAVNAVCWLLDVVLVDDIEQEVDSWWQQQVVAWARPMLRRWLRRGCRNVAAPDGAHGFDVKSVVRGFCYCVKMRHKIM